MTNAVFYSVCPFGTGTIETGAGTIEITSGVATLSVAQTGNIGAGVCVEYNSIECWIAPNRIAFTSGGTTELLTGTKIAGGTSGATGIVRAIEVNSGTWAGGDAAGWIYFEATTGTWGSSEQINRTKPTSSTNIATTNGSLEGNIGNGNTEFVVKNATGGAASNQTSTSVTSVHHEWAALVDFESQFTDSSHIGSTSLVTADVVAYACCYYDHANPTTNPDDNAVSVEFGTTGVDNYLQIYTPVGEAESINCQRHDGKWNTGKYRLEITDGALAQAIYAKESYTVVDGLQVKRVNTTVVNCFGIASDSGGDNFNVSNNIVWGSFVASTNYAGGIPLSVSGYVWNNIVYGFDTTSGYGIRHYTNSGTVYVYNNTVYDGGKGVWAHYAMVAKNNISYDSDPDFYDTSFTTSDYNFSKDDTAPGANSIHGTTDGKTPDFVNTGAGTEDLHLQSTSDAIDVGTPLTSVGIWRDIIGTERGTSWDIGAFEYVSAGPSVSIPVIMHHLRQQGIS